MRLPAAVLVLAFLAIAPSASLSQETELTPITDRAEAVALLAEYAGRWSGRGLSRTDFESELEEASCALTTVYDVEAAMLTNSGRCANRVRAISIDGTLGFTETGELTGGYFGRFEQAELLSSSGRLYQEGFVVEARYRLELRGTLREIDVSVSVDRPLVRPNGQKVFSIVIMVRNPDTGEFVEFSSFEFTLNTA